MDILIARNQLKFMDHPSIKTIPFAAILLLRSSIRHGPFIVAFMLFLKTGRALLIFIHFSYFLRDLLSVWH